MGLARAGRFDLAARGRVGRMGEVEVAARYGEVRYSEALLTQIASRAKELAP